MGCLSLLCCIDRASKAQSNHHPCINTGSSTRLHIGHALRIDASKNNTYLMSVGCTKERQRNVWASRPKNEAPLPPQGSVLCPRGTPERVFEQDTLLGEGGSTLPLHQQQQAAFRVASFCSTYVEFSLCPFCSSRYQSPLPRSHALNGCCMRVQGIRRTQFG